MRKLKTAIALSLILPILACADSVTVNMYTATETGDGRGDFIGTVVFTDSQEYGGVIITPDLNSIPPGVHGFHIHEYPNCSPKMHDGHETPALAAGGHFDPENTGKHLGPYADGHLGDLPILFVSTEGTATHTMYAPRLRAADIKNHSLMIHAGGDNYSDTPNALGGGGARLACGVVE